jgi:hypothetical protein
MKKRVCQFEGCNQKPMPGEDVQAIYNRFELPGASIMGSFSFCKSHAMQAAERAFKRLCGETRVTDPDASARLARLKQIQSEMNDQPAEHYGYDFNSRILRLIEIEQSLRAPTLAQREQAELQERLYQLQKRAARIKPKPVDNRAQLFRYLQSKGLDPIKLGNW